MLRRRAGPSGAQRVGNTPRSTAGSWNNVTELRDSRHALLPERLKTESREVAREQNIAETEFKASRGSMSCFMRQNNLRLRRRAVLHRRLPEGFPREVLEFQKSLKRRRLEWDYFPSWTGDAADRKTEKVEARVHELLAEDTVFPGAAEESFPSPCVGFSWIGSHLPERRPGNQATAPAPRKTSARCGPWE
ncbi:uncharacterized protein LOC119921614 isoform X4 [Tachyglossus aculeatus]|uniref:uncharacterized protein LOC119921614 isoform X4 n=1 Tax=Tachyglossus aculeatus TaxID=9261 RepID=UPI0018F6C998|nr:uncharacterized protein LOC119921614 isoform X4 [Tachyglossus aculeatus]